MRRPALFAAAIGVICSSAAMAEEKDPSPGPASPTQPYRLGEVVVSSRPEESLAGQTLFVVTDDQMRATGARTLNEAVNLLPGINVRTGNLGIPRIDIRGLPPRHVPIFLNSIPLNSAADGQFDPSLIPVENIAEIKVIEGNSSVLYGPGTTAGVIDIITKRGAEGIHGDFQPEFGSGEAHFYRGDVNGARGTENFFISGSHYDLKGFPLPSGDVRDNSDKTNNNAFLNVGGTPKDDWTMGLSFNYLNGRQGIPPSLINNPADPFATTPIFERLDNIEGKSGQFDVRYSPAGRFNARMSLYINTLDEIDNRFDNNQYNSMVDPTVQTFHQLISTEISGGQVQANYDLGRAGGLAASVMARREAESLAGEVRDVPLTGGGRRGGGTATFAFRTLDNKFDTGTYSAAAEYTVSPVQNTHLVTGFSHHWFTQSDHSVDQADQWTAGASYDVLPPVQLKTSYGHKVRFPTLQELFDVEKGHPNLRPEKSDDFETGINWRIRPDTGMLVTGFYNHLSNFIQNNQATQTFTNKNSLFRGFEAVGQTRIVPDLSLNAGYTFLYATDETTGARTDFQPRHKAGVTAIYALPFNVSATASVLYFADQVVSSKSSTPLRQENLPDYTLVNLRLSWTLPVQHFTLYVGADNIFNSSYVFSPGFPAPGRFVYGGAIASF